jgi:NADH dehydrogenase (ubiquinone) 1 alpha subcomplex subunit 9
MLHDDSTAEQTFELYGPKNYSTAEIAELVDREIVKKRRHINLPKAVLKPFAGLLNKALWWPVLSADEVEREFIDQKIDPTAKTFKDLGITPADISSLTFHYLVSPLEYRDAVESYLQPCSKGIEVRHFMIFHQQQSVRREKRRNIYTFLTTSKKLGQSRLVCI